MCCFCAFLRQTDKNGRKPFVLLCRTGPTRAARCGGKTCVETPCRPVSPLTWRETPWILAGLGLTWNRPRSEDQGFRRTRGDAPLTCRPLKNHSRRRGARRGRCPAPGRRRACLPAADAALHRGRRPTATAAGRAKGPRAQPVRRDRRRLDPRAGPQRGFPAFVLRCGNSVISPRACSTPPGTWSIRTWRASLPPCGTAGRPIRCPPRACVDRRALSLDVAPGARPCRPPKGNPVRGGREDVVLERQPEFGVRRSGAGGSSARLSGRGGAYFELVLVHVWGGQPGRSDDGATLRGEVVLQPNRDKTESSNGFANTIARFLPSTVSKPLVACLPCLVAPGRAATPPAPTISPSPRYAAVICLAVEYADRLVSPPRDLCGRCQVTHRKKRAPALGIQETYSSGHYAEDLVDETLAAMGLAEARAVITPLDLPVIRYDGSPFERYAYQQKVGKMDVREYHDAAGHAFTCSQHT